jgi:hypothetical protein
LNGRGLGNVLRPDASSGPATAHMKEDNALDPLRKREDFQKLLGECEAKK